MIAPAFQAYKEHSLDMGTFVVGVEGFDFSGSTARLRIGRVGGPSWLEWASDEPPDEGVFTWDDAERELACDLPASAFDAPEIGRYTYQITIISAAGVALSPPLEGPFKVLPVVGAPG
jgi:hypothetical protein